MSKLAESQKVYFSRPAEPFAFGSLAESEEECALRSYVAGYDLGLTGQRANVSSNLDGLNRFAFARGWAKGFKEYLANLPPPVKVGIDWGI